jgi:hypothetical protein
MTNVIVEAMKRYIKDSPPPMKSTMKELDQTLKELQKLWKIPADDDSDESDDDSNTTYEYTSSSYTSVTSSSSDRYTRDSRQPANFELPAGQDADPVIEMAQKSFEDNITHELKTALPNPEEDKRRSKRIQRIVNVAKETRSEDEKLILAYMFDEIPLHFRRTLDQYYYYTLHTTEARDRDQVVSRYIAKTWPDDENMVLMVDQLWLWILDKGAYSF